MSKYYYLEYDAGTHGTHLPFKVVGYGRKIQPSVLQLSLTYSTSKIFSTGTVQEFYWMNFKVCEYFDTMEELTDKHMLDLL